MSDVCQVVSLISLGVQIQAFHHLNLRKAVGTPVLTDQRMVPGTKKRKDVRIVRSLFLHPFLQEHGKYT